MLLRTSLGHQHESPDAVLPNKRLKLPGGDRFMGSGVFCPSMRQLTLNIMTACGRVARSLSAAA